LGGRVIQTPAWRVLAASAIGTSHLARHSVCQDANLHLTMPDGTLLIAVADGAGSASRSAEGAACATRTALDFLAERLPRTEQWQVEALLSESMSAAREALFSLADDGSSAGDFATTLLLTVVTGEQISIAQLGDGAIVIQLQDEKLQVLTRNGDSEYVNQTTFLTSSNFENSIGLASWPADGVRGVAVMTDGIQLLAVHHGTNTAFGAFFAPMFRFAADVTSTDAGLAEFLASDAVSRRTDDDKTLVLTVRV
jgi:hypothetical protein